MAKVFVSYARDESRKVYRILNRLRAHGIEFWVDTQDIETGKDWAEEISKAIKNCRRFLLFMSHKSMASPNTSQEVKIAFGSHKRFVILRMDNVKLPIRLKYALEGIQWTEYLSPKWETEIVSALGGGRKFFRKPKPSPARPVSIQSPRSLSRKPPKPEQVITQLQRTFSGDRTLHNDQYAIAISKLDDLRWAVGSHWINPAFAYDELVPRVHLLKKIDLLNKLIRDAQESRPPGSSTERQLIQNELAELLQELSRKTNR